MTRCGWGKTCRFSRCRTKEMSPLRTSQVSLILPAPKTVTTGSTAGREDIPTKLIYYFLHMDPS